MMKKQQIIILGVIFLVALGVIGSYSFRLLPVVVEHRVDTSPSTAPELQKGDEVQLFKDYHFDKGNYAIYIVFSAKENVEFPKVLFTDEHTVLNQLKESFELTYTGGDLATCESFLYLLKGDKVVLKMGIVLDEVSGLQSSEYGWLEFKDRQKPLESLKLLSPVYRPYIKL